MTLKKCPLRERVFSIRPAGVLSSVVRYPLTYFLLHPGMESEAVLFGAGVGVRWFWHDRISVTHDLANALKDSVEIQSGDWWLHFNVFFQF